MRTTVRGSSATLFMSNYIGRNNVPRTSIPGGGSKLSSKEAWLSDFTLSASARAKILSAAPLAQVTLPCHTGMALAEPCEQEVRMSPNTIRFWLGNRQAKDRSAIG